MKDIMIFIIGNENHEIKIKNVAAHNEKGANHEI